MVFWRNCLEPKLFGTAPLTDLRHTMAERREAEVHSLDHRATSSYVCERDEKKLCSFSLGWATRKMSCRPFIHPRLRLEEMQIQLGGESPCCLRQPLVELFSHVWLPRCTVTTTAVDGGSRTTWTRSRIRTVLLDFQASKV